MNRLRILSHIFASSAARPCSIYASVSNHHRCCLQFTIASCSFLWLVSIVELVCPLYPCIESLTTHTVRTRRNEGPGSLTLNRQKLCFALTLSFFFQRWPMSESALTSSDELGWANLQRTKSRNDELSAEWCDISVLVLGFRPVKLSKQTLCHACMFVCVFVYVHRLFCEWKERKGTAYTKSPFISFIHWFFFFFFASNMLCSQMSWVLLPVCSFCGIVIVAFVLMFHNCNCKWGEHKAATHCWVGAYHAKLEKNWTVCVYAHFSW